MRSCYKCNTLTSLYDQYSKTSNPNIFCEKCVPISKEQLYECYVTKDWGFKKIAKEKNISLKAVKRFLKIYGIPKREPNQKYEVSKEELTDLLLNQNLTVRDAAKALNMEYESVHYYKSKYKIEKTKEQKYDAFSRARTQIPCPISKVELNQLYLTKNLSQNDLAEKFNVDRGIIKSWLRRYKIPTEKSLEKQQLASQKTFKKNRNIQSVTYDELYDLFINQNLTYRELMKVINCSFAHIRNLLFKWNLTGIKSRTDVAASHYNFTSGPRIDVGLARSLWEANLKRILQYLKIPYEYEEARLFFIAKETTILTGLKGNTKYIKGNKYHYIPDFKILTKNPFYIEVKGFFSEADQYQLNNVKFNYPLYLLQKDQYLKLEKQFQKLIPMWESTTKNIITNPEIFGTKDRVKDIQTIINSFDITNHNDLINRFNLDLGKKFN